MFLRNLNTFALIFTRNNMNVSKQGELSSNGISISVSIAKLLLERAIKFDVSNGFVWTSGITSPIYCDNRILVSDVRTRSLIIEAFTEVIRSKYLLNTDIIAAVATGGIPYGALIADRLGLPLIYVNKERKKHGLKKWVEGAYKADDKVLLIEDHISTGGSSMNAIEGLKGEKLDLICLLSIMTYGFKKAEDSFKRSDIKHESLCNLEAILAVALEQDIITPSEQEQILQFREFPNEWKPVNK